ncbi:MAG: TonB family protein [Candidatus Cloacimonetes bacterium]|nr:TonB family protein [Candidatus Cloacimonadota bacterium]
MRKSNKLNVILLIFFTLFFTNLFSSPVNSSTAKTVAEFHLNIHKVSNSFSVDNTVELRDDKSILLAHIVNLKPKGFIVIAGDTSITPIIAYSFKSDFYMNKDSKNTLYHMLKKDLENRNSEISSGSAKNIQKNIDLWNQYINKNDNYFQARNFKKWPESGSRNTDGIIQTTWSQNAPYNDNCPIDPTTGKRCFVGSAAIAIAQIINYHKHLGYASFRSTDSYTTLNGINIDQDSQTADFPSFSTINKKLENINKKYSNGSSLNNDDLATINLAAGISVNMHYSSDAGADSWTWDIADAFRNKFKFTKSKVYYADSEDFFTQLKTNAKKKFPVNILIEDYFEHSLICDGYNTDNEYHLNFGWAQGSNENYTLAWYNLPKSLNPDYNIISQAIMFIGEGITPVRVAEAGQEKILLDEETTIDFFEEDDSEEVEQDSGEDQSTIDEAVQDVLEDDTIPIIGTSDRIYVIYEVPPVPIKRVAPKYPTFIKRRGIQGKVWLDVEVLETGKVGDVKVVVSLFPGKGGLDEAAITAVKKWKFEPAKSGGKNVACRVKFPIIFNLN